MFPKVEVGNSLVRADLINWEVFPNHLVRATRTNFVSERSTDLFVQRNNVLSHLSLTLTLIFLLLWNPAPPSHHSGSAPPAPMGLLSVKKLPERRLRGRDSSKVFNGYVHTAYLKWINNYCMTQRTRLNVMWQPGGVGSFGENGYMYVSS